MWILKNSKELFDNLQSHPLTSIHSIKTYDFSTLYTTIPHTRLIARLSGLIKNAFRCKNWEKALRIYCCRSYFRLLHTLLRTLPMYKNKYLDDIVRMLEFLIDNIFVECSRALLEIGWLLLLRNYMAVTVYWLTGLKFRSRISSLTCFLRRFTVDDLFLCQFTATAFADIDV